MAGPGSAPRRRKRAEDGFDRWLMAGRRREFEGMNRVRQWMVLCAALSCVLERAGRTASFEIGEKDFLLEGRPVVLRSGEMHYPRVPREYWGHRLRMVRAMGLNTVSTYVFWNLHEPKPGQFEFSGQADVAGFCRVAQQEGLKVIVRPGPYVCGEWDLGGLPWWLLEDPKVRLRSRHPAFLEAASRYFQALGRQLAPLQVSQGGPIILVQVENEYLGYGRDPKYVTALAEALRAAGFEVPLFTADMAWTIGGTRGQGLFSAICGGKLEEGFQALRAARPAGPLMSAEFYTGWYDAWGLAHQDSADFRKKVSGVEWMLARGISFNLYMAHGGTTFGLHSGANGPPFRPATTSYDYEAPITEAGWTTPQYEALRAVLSQHLAKGETLPPVPPRPPVIKIPPMAFDEVAPLLDALPKPKRELRPRPMETYGQGQGCILYRTKLGPGGGERLIVPEAHDYCWVFLEGRKVGALDRGRAQQSLVLPEREATNTLDLLVEAAGRLHYGAGFHDRKGITERVTLVGASGPRELTGWEVFNLALDRTNLAGLRFTRGTTNVPAFYRGRFELEATGDTFLDFRAWHKGMAWINGRHLGRYWSLGPQQTLYCPGPWLKRGNNELIVLELEGAEKPRVTGLAGPVLDQLDLAAGGRRHRKPGQTVNLAGWAPAFAGSFPPSAQWHRVDFPAVKGRYVGLEALNSHRGDAYTTCAELMLVGEDGRELSREGWRVVYADSEEATAENGGADNLLDLDPETFWHTEWQGQGPPHPHSVVIDLGREQTVQGLLCLPRRGSANGRIKEFRLYVSPTPFPEN